MRIVPSLRTLRIIPSLRNLRIAPSLRTLAVTLSVRDTGQVAQTAAPTLAAIVTPTNDEPIAVSGTAMAGSTVRVKVDGSTVATVTATGGGTYTASLAAVAEGTHSITATAQSAAELESAPSAAQSIVVDRTAPGAPAITSPTSPHTTTAATVALSGTAEANAIVRIERDGVEVATTTASGLGAWSAAGLALPALATYAFRVRAEDLAGNVGAYSSTVSVTRQDLLNVSFAIDGANIGKALGLRAVLRARHNYLAGSGHAAINGEPSPEGMAQAYYEHLWITDWYYMARVYPQHFAAARVRAVVDAFAASVGQDPFARSLTAVAQFIAFSADTVGGEVIAPGGFGFRPGAGGYYPALGNNFEFAQLIVLAHDRGDNNPTTGAFATHLAKAEAALDGAPRNAGLLYCADWTTNWSSGWNWEDGQQVSGQLMLASAEYARSYRELARVATALGRTTDATRLSGKGDTILTALAGLRDGANGLYRPGTNDATVHGIPHSAFMVAFGYLSGADLTQTINTLKAGYDASLTANGGITRRGSIRALNAGQFYPHSLGAQGESMNGGYRGGSFLSRWFALALHEGGYTAEARALAQASLDETLREQRIAEQTGNAQAYAPPWEYESNTSGSPYGSLGARFYGLSAGHLESTTDSRPDYVDIALNAGNGYSAEAVFAHGNQVSRVEILGTQAVTATITVDACAEIASATDPWPEPAPSYGAFDATLGTISLAGETNKAAVAITPRKTAGGKIRARVTAGVGGGTITVRLHQTCTPVLGAVPGGATIVSDDFTTDTLVANYLNPGLFTVSGGVLRGPGAAAWKDCFRSGGYAAFADGSVSVDVSASDAAHSWVIVAMRVATTDQVDQVYVSFYPDGSLSIWEVVSGAGVTLATAALTPWANGAAHTLKVECSGTTVRAYVDGVLRLIATTTRTAAGYFGVRAYSDNGTQAQFDNLAAFQPVAINTGSIPPGYVLEWGGNTGAVTDDDFSTAVGTVNLLDSTGAVVSTRNAPVQITW